MIITNAKIITWEKRNRVLGDHAIHISGDKIQEIAPQSKLVQMYPDEEKVDADGNFVMPGNICAHTHFYGAYSRGLAIPGRSPADFVEILQKLWWPLDKVLDEEAIKYSALVCMLDAIKHGTTTLIDHHASPGLIDGSLDIIAEAATTTGLRIATCYEVTDRNGTEGTASGIKENIRFLKSVRRRKTNRIAALFGLHASLTLSDETLTTSREAAPDGTGFHIHVAEHQADEYDSLAKSGLRVVDRLHRHGILGENSVVAHCVHVDAREIELLADTGTWVTHQPRSNMNNAVGMAEVESMLRAGVRVGLGNDGFSNAMWEEWKAAYLAHKLWHKDPRKGTGYDVVEMAVYNNAELASQVFACPVGMIQSGAQADLIFVDYHRFTPVSPENLPWHILFGFHESMVVSTMVAGEFLMKNRKINHLDQNEIYQKALEISPRVWEKYNNNFV